MQDVSRSGDDATGSNPAADASGGPDANTLLTRRFWEAVNDGNLDQVARLVSDDYINFRTSVDGPTMIRRWASSRRDAFPDLRFEVQQELVAGDWVVHRMLATGTFTGHWHEHGFDDVVPTGRRHEAIQIHLFRIVDNKIAEHLGCSR